jgi:hypothetical protein
MQTVACNTTFGCAAPSNIRSFECYMQVQFNCELKAGFAELQQGHDLGQSPTPVGLGSKSVVGLARSWLNHWCPLPPTLLEIGFLENPERFYKGFSGNPREGFITNLFLVFQKTFREKPLWTPFMHADSTPVSHLSANSVPKRRSTPG